MPSLASQPGVIVAGAGVFGLSIALACQRRSLHVRLLDPKPSAANASSVAAGLLAPFGEALFDARVAAHHPLLMAALALWPRFAAAHGLCLCDDGLIAPAEYAAAATVRGAKVEARGGDVLIHGDSQVVDPPRALAVLDQAFRRGGGQVEARPVGAGDAGFAERLVLAAGPGALALASIAPELAWLTPVKGQIAVLPRGPAAGPTVRWAGGYLAPQTGGARVGATMEEGAIDTNIDPAAIDALIAQAKAHVPGLDATGAYGQAGVRMQSPDSLPLVGPSRTPSVLLAAGARRNGWLLAPLVAEMIAAYVVGEDPGPWAAMLHPTRFG